MKRNKIQSRKVERKEGGRKNQDRRNIKEENKL
jgi:hypothetical protein